MSEKIPHKEKAGQTPANERTHRQESAARTETRAVSGHELLSNTPEASGETRSNHKDELARQIESLNARARESARPAEAVNILTERESTPDTAPTPPVNAELKSIAYRRTIRSVQKSLPAADRGLSIVIHNPVVEAISERGANTIARPSGVLAGGLTALVGSGLLYMAARYYGYEYDPTAALILFAGGFMAGLTIEAVWRLVRR